MAGRIPAWGGAVAALCVALSCGRAQAGSLVDSAATGAGEGTSVTWHVAATSGVDAAGATGVKLGREAGAAWTGGIGASLTGLYRGDLKMERLDDGTWRDSRAGTNWSPGRGEGLLGLLGWKRSPPPEQRARRDVVMVDGESSWTVFKTLPLAGTLSMVFCLGILLVLLLRGSRP